MLKDVWPDMVTAIPLPESRSIWEGTRFGVEKELAPELRRHIVRELVVAYLDFASATGIRQIIGVMPTLIWRAVFMAQGWPVEILGEPRILGGDKCVAGLLPVNREIVSRVQAKTGVTTSVLNLRGGLRHAETRHVA